MPQQDSDSEATIKGASKHTVTACHSGLEPELELLKELAPTRRPGSGPLAGPSRNLRGLGLPPLGTLY